MLNADTNRKDTRLDFFLGVQISRLKSSYSNREKVSGRTDGLAFSRHLSGSFVELRCVCGTGGHASFGRVSPGCQLAVAPLWLHLTVIIFSVVRMRRRGAEPGGPRRGPRGDRAPRAPTMLRGVDAGRVRGESPPTVPAAAETAPRGGRRRAADAATAARRLPWQRRTW